MEKRASFDLPSSGTGGMRPAQAPPPEWKKQAPGVGKEAPQGPAKTSRPTSRSLNPTAVGTGGNYSRGMIEGRPGVVAQRALAPLSSELIDVYQDAPGGFVAQELAGVGTLAANRPQPGNDGNVAGNGDYTGDLALAKGSASKTTGRPVKGGTGGKGMI